jgi:hypothetical protein
LIDLAEVRVQYISMCENLSHLDNLIAKHRESLLLLESMRASYAVAVQGLAEKLVEEESAGK